MANNKDPFVRSRSKDGVPDLFMGKVQAGATQAIKVGEICCYNKTAGYWVPVSAVADFVYALAIAKEEQKSTDAARYIIFYSLAPDDEFIFEYAAARTAAVGDGFTLTASDSQKLTYSATAVPVARHVDYSNTPESGTTLGSVSHGIVKFNPDLTHWGLIKTGLTLGRSKPIVATAARTLYAEQSGLLIHNTGASGAVIHTLPQSCPAGTVYTAYATVAQDHGFAPGAAGAIYVEGAKQTDDKDVTVDGIGDMLRVTSLGDGDWIAEAVISSAADATGAIDVES